ncbi:hypothetical protein [Thermomonospora cellulosilytica]|uniref:Tail assembly chaperone n=1 Tax=Thermomonospora cellulosilytica TaxID=1411118 RepID=A0A7W3MXK8_9ACTN|nr:hypothetical protein [Thermomonospora cellulosilytica]MBA9003731.1 hypothetical protein [Thermomonospora cellulosilytica]
MTENPSTIDADEVDEAGEAGETIDFNAWLATEQAARGGGKRIRVFGKVIALPTDLPLGFTLALDQTSESSDLDDVKKMVAALYGDDALDHWVKEGLGLFGFQVLLAYGSAVAAGQTVTLDEVAAKVREANKQREQGKAQKPGRGKKGKRQR